MSSTPAMEPSGGTPLEALYAADPHRAEHGMPRARAGGGFRTLAILDGTGAADAARQAIDAGAQGLWLHVAPSGERPPASTWPAAQGVDLPNDDAWWALLGEADLADQLLIVDAGHDAAHATEGLLRLLEARHIQAREQSILVLADPYGPCLVANDSAGRAQAEREQAALLEGALLELPRTRPIALCTPVLQDLGADTVTELAYLAALQEATWRRLGAAEHTADTIAARSHVVLSAEPDLLTGIAKLRAARVLLARGHAAAGGTPHPVPITVRASWRSLTARDPDTNMLRLTGQAAGAVLGGAEGVALLPYDVALGAKDPEARRFAVTALRVLGDEAALGAIEDPFSGSYAVESLTGALLDAAEARKDAVLAGATFEEAFDDRRWLTAAYTDLAERAEQRAAGASPQIGVDLHPREGERVPVREDGSDEALWSITQEGSA